MSKPLPHAPCHDWIVAIKRPLPEGAQMPIVHGLYQPVRKPPHHYADVIAVGPGRAHPQTGFTPALPCQVGDVVMVREVAGDPETIEGIEYHWFIPDEIMAIVTGEIEQVVMPPKTPAIVLAS